MLNIVVSHIVNCFRFCGHFLCCDLCLTFAQSAGFCVLHVSLLELN